jgi:Xaa-Pro aminopeptidase
LAREILDEQIKDEESMELIEQVAELANRCLDMASDQRPPMREVAVADELERFRKSKVQLRSMNFLCCVIPVHRLLKCVITVPKLNLGL